MKSVTDNPTRRDQFERRQQIAEAIRKGKSVSQVACAFMVSVQTVRNACAEHGVSWPSSRRRRPEPVA